MTPFDGHLTRIEPAGPDVNVYHYDADAPFVAGQFFNLHVPGAPPREERSYSAWAAPSEPTLSFLIRLTEHGAAGTFLRAAQVGDVHQWRGPFGRFKMPEGDGPVWMIATGTGLAPLRSMLVEAGHSNRSVRLLFGARTMDECFGIDALRALPMPGLRVEVCLSREVVAGTHAGRVTAALGDAPSPSTEVLLCGSLAMVSEVRAMLLAGGHPRERIRSEGYG